MAYRTFCDRCDKNVTNETYHLVKIDDHSLAKSTHNLYCQACFEEFTILFNNWKNHTVVV